jgi:hypothetical protein
MGFNGSGGSNGSAVINKINIDNFISIYAKNWSEIQLLNPEIALRISEIIVNNLSAKIDSDTTVNNAYTRFIQEIVPLMRSDLGLTSNKDEAKAKSRWQFWK